MARKDRDQTAQRPSSFCNTIDKVASVRRSTGGSEASTVPPTTARFDQFVECSMEDVRQVITAIPAKSCVLDPIPTDVLKTFLPELLPYATAMCNALLLQSCLPQSQRHATVIPTVLFVAPCGVLTCSVSAVGFW